MYNIRMNNKKNNTDILEGVAQYINNSSWTIGIWLIVVAAFIASSILAYADYRASVEGYLMLPTEKITPGVEIAFGLLPQIAQILLGIFTYISARNKSPHTWIYGALTVAFFLVDSGTDHIALVGDATNSFWAHAVALIQSIIVYTLLSEWMFVTSLGLLIQTTPKAFTDMAEFIKGMLDGINALLGILQDDEEPTLMGSNNIRRVNKEHRANQPDPRLPPRKN